MTDPEDNQEAGASEALELVEAGSDLVGSLGGAGIGLLVGGPAGAIVGAALGPTLKHAALVVHSRFFGKERERVGAALGYITADQQQRRNNGEEPREDGFFDWRGDLRPEAEELVEAILRQAAETYEERKLPYLSRVYTAVEFDPTVSAAEALFLVRLAGELTYRQYVALAVYASVDEHGQQLNDLRATDEEEAKPLDSSVMRELDDLANRQLIGIGGPRGVVQPNSVFQPLTLRDETRSGDLRLLPAGERLASLLGVADIDKTERDGWLKDLLAARAS